MSTIYKESTSYIKSFYTWWRRLPRKQKRQLLTNGIIVLAIFLTVIATVTIKYLDSRSSAMTLVEGVVMKREQMDIIEQNMLLVEPTIAPKKKTAEPIEESWSLTNFFKKFAEFLGIRE